VKYGGPPDTGYMKVVAIPMLRYRRQTLIFWGGGPRAVIAFSSEVDTGSREETRQNHRALF
jgi:hypothetical protein